MTSEILISTDLDRTLLPNGPEPESVGARSRFGSVAGRNETRIAYVTGRHLELASEAISTYRLPEPDYLVSDVGTSIYTVEHGEWRLDASWHFDIGRSWGENRREDLEVLLRDIEGLRLQPSERQGTYKLSYFTPLDVDVSRLLAHVNERLARVDAASSLIWSRDELDGVGLLDVLPERATKRHAVEFLIETGGFQLENTLFAGDSGNDLPVLSSGIPSVLVANAADEVRREALRLATEDGTADSLYLARGGLLGMNGNYSAGLLEGLVHFIPRAAEWIGP